MSVVAFDTHKFVKRLQDAGFSEAQAEAVTQAVQEAASLDLSALATKADMTSGLLATKQEIEARILVTKQELEARVRESELRLEAKIEAAKTDLLKTLIGAVAFNSAVVLGAMFGLAKLLGH